MYDFGFMLNFAVCDYNAGLARSYIDFNVYVFIVKVNKVNEWLLKVLLSYKALSYMGSILKLIRVNH